MNEAGRRERIASALQGAKDADTHRLPWRDRYQAFPVVELPLDAVMLSSTSHRIRAQLESHERSELVRDDPFSAEAQDVIADILRGLDGFTDLRENLRETEQREPGVVTRAGLLVNANRRAVALRDIQRSFIRVAVLPKDADNEEIDQLELRLQMQRDFRERYSFTNELLFVHDLAFRHNYAGERIARELEWAVSDDPSELRKGAARVQRSLRMLSYIREVQTLGAPKVKLTFFDDKQQSLIELDDELQRMGGSDDVARQRVKDLRMVGILLELGYKPLRQMDEDFVEDFLYEHLKEDEIFGSAAEALTEPTDASAGSLPGLDVLEGQGDGSDGRRSARPLLDFVVEAFREGSAQVPGSILKIDRSSLSTTLGPVITDAATAAKESHRKDDDVAAPLDYAKAARQKLRRTKESFERVRGNAALDRSKLAYQLKKIVHEAQDLLHDVE